MTGARPAGSPSESDRERSVREVTELVSDTVVPLSSCEGYDAPAPSARSACPSTTRALRLSPANFARFIGDFRNAALKSACSIARRSRASVSAFLPAMNARGLNAGSFSSCANLILNGQQLWAECRQNHFRIELSTGRRTLSRTTS